jgi:hypothetical protein
MGLKQEPKLGVLVRTVPREKVPKPTKPQTQGKQPTSDKAEARKLLTIVEKSQVPFGESAPAFAELKAKIDKGEALTIEEYERLLKLVKIANEWEKDVEASARTEPEETLSG